MSRPYAEGISADGDYCKADSGQDYAAAKSSPRPLDKYAVAENKEKPYAIGEHNGPYVVSGEPEPAKVYARGERKEDEVYVMGGSNGDYCTGQAGSSKVAYAGGDKKRKRELPYVMQTAGSKEYCSGQVGKQPYFVAY
ncbi:hypothetical protein QOT17_009612 [Balamuthia mandrillaris]